MIECEQTCVANLFSTYLTLENTAFFYWLVDDQLLVASEPSEKGDGQKFRGRVISQNSSAPGKFDDPAVILGS